MLRLPALSAVTLLGLLPAATLAGEPDEVLSPGSLAGWRLVSTVPADLTAACHWTADGTLAVSGQPVAFIETAATHRDYQLHAEWRWPGKPGNGGVLVHIDSGPKDRAWPSCYQIQLKHGAAGDVLPMAGAAFAEPLTSPPGATAVRAKQAADSEHAAGEWNRCDITCRGDTIEVSINGVLQNRVTGCTLSAGRVGFQLEGAPFELRHVRVSPLRNPAPEPPSP